MSAAASVPPGAGEDDLEVLCGDQEALRREWNRIRTERERTSSPGTGASPAGSNEKCSDRGDASDSDSLVEGETREWEEARSKRRKTNRRDEGNRRGTSYDSQEDPARKNSTNGWGSWFWQGFETVKLHDYLKRLAELRRRRAAQHAEEAHARTPKGQETHTEFDERWNTVAGFWRRKMAQNRDFVPSKRRKERTRTREKGPETPRSHGRSGSGSARTYANWYSWRAQSSKSGEEFQRAGSSTAHRPEASTEARQQPGFKRSREGAYASHSPHGAHDRSPPHQSPPQHSQSPPQHSQSHNHTPQTETVGGRTNDVQDRVRERVENLRTQQQVQAMHNATREQVRETVSKKLDFLRRPHVTSHVLLRAVGVSVEGGHCPTKKQIDVAMKKAMLRFHPDRCRGSHVPLEKQVESEEIFKLLNQRRQADSRA